MSFDFFSRAALSLPSSRKVAEEVGAISGLSWGVSMSLTGVEAYRGVRFRDELTEEVSGEREPGTMRRPWAAISAASDRDNAEEFFLVLNENLALGWIVARVSESLSCRALIACANVGN